MALALERKVSPNPITDPPAEPARREDEIAGGKSSLNTNGAEPLLDKGLWLGMTYPADSRAKELFSDSRLDPILVKPDEAWSILSPNDAFSPRRMVEPDREDLVIQKEQAFEQRQPEVQTKPEGIPVAIKPEVVIQSGQVNPEDLSLPRTARTDKQTNPKPANSGRRSRAKTAMGLAAALALVGCIPQEIIHSNVLADDYSDHPAVMPVPESLTQEQDGQPSQTAQDPNLEPTQLDYDLPITPSPIMELGSTLVLTPEADPQPLTNPETETETQLQPEPELQPEALSTSPNPEDTETELEVSTELPPVQPETETPTPEVNEDDDLTGHKAEEVVENIPDWYQDLDRNEVSYQDIAKANNIVEPKSIYLNQALLMPNGTIYYVQKGDTLWDISQNWKNSALNTEKGGINKLESAVIGGFHYVVPKDQEFSNKDVEAIIDSVRIVAEVYSNSFGPCNNLYTTSIVPKIRDANKTYPQYFAYYYGPNSYEGYPGGVIFFDLTKIRQEALLSSNNVFLQAIAAEVAHAWSVPDLPFEGLVEELPLSDTTGIERDELVMAAYVMYLMDYPSNFNDSSPINKTIEKYPLFYRLMRQRWEQSGGPSYVDENTWVSWANYIWPGFRDWWVRDGRGWN